MLEGANTPSPAAGGPCLGWDITAGLGHCAWGRKGWEKIQLRAGQWLEVSKKPEQ